MYICFRTLKSQETGRYWSGMVNTETGEIIARSNKPIMERRLTIKSRPEPSTEEATIVRAARKKIKELSK